MVDASSWFCNRHGCRSSLEGIEVTETERAERQREKRIATRKIWVILWRKKRGTTWRIWNCPVLTSKLAGENMAVYYLTSPLNTQGTRYRVAEFREVKR